MPPGMPALATLVRMGGHGSTVATKAGPDTWEPAPAWTSYWGTGAALSADYTVTAIRGNIATVDDHLYDPAEPPWYDTGMVGPDGSYLSQGRPTCHWKRFTPKDHGERPSSERET